MKKDCKLNTSGFMLVETLLVSLTIAGILIYMFAQYSTINDTYQRLYNYNTTERLYHTDVIKQFLVTYTEKKAGSGNLYTSTLANATNKSYDLTNCGFMPSGADRTYCTSLMTAIEADQVILTHADISTTTVKNGIVATATAKNKTAMKNFLKQIESVAGNKYRLIIVFNDETIATLVFEATAG
jgi:hypothetical protein